MDRSTTIKTAFTMAQIAGVTASSAALQLQSSITQAGNYQKSTYVFGENTRQICVREQQLGLPLLSQ